MCGIVGYIGKSKASPILIKGLSKLEYRGYDSAGIATIEDDKICHIKNKGRVKELENSNKLENLKGTIGIAHTRWATHGKPSSINAHPHLDSHENFAVVHNGIIENYRELREFLINAGYTFNSETDSEIIPNLIDYYYSKETSNDKFLNAVHNAEKDLKGSYALAILSKFDPNKIIVIKKDSPLVIGTKDNEKYIASDINAILEYTNDIFILKDGDLAYISENKIDFYNNNLNLVNRTPEKITWDAKASDKGDFEDFMLKEIYEQPVSIRETIGTRIVPNKPCDFSDINITKKYLSDISRIYIIACGTAMHAGISVKPIFERLTNIPVEVDIASEFRYRDPLIDEHTLIICISQSGETADTIAALKNAKTCGSKTIAISNVIGSSITREADFTLYTHAGPEIAVASTKAYTAQITLLVLLAIHFAEVLELPKNEIINNLKEELLEIPSKISIILENTDIIKKFAKKIHKETDIFFVGRGIDYATAMESSLKLKEISYIHSDSYQSGELKHGPIALIEDDVTVIGIITDRRLIDKSISNLQEVISRGAKTLIVTNQEIDTKLFPNVFSIPKVHPLISPLVSIVPLQLLSYYVAKEKNLDVDKPRNLAKSVTVE
ncbi:MAG: glutamine--fructose-6-phosphate transaminase (isomerizing) [Clostridia bacterium]|jgi:glucosamine--fructose-6-phosphate aminotransferase (isomerizing)|nr:glutamine--fructose-6-phosphate transaminase (isomerizing) [Clostridia bacterium]